MCRTMFYVLKKTMLVTVGIEQPRTTLKKVEQQKVPLPVPVSVPLPLSVYSPHGLSVLPVLYLITFTAAVSWNINRQLLVPQAHPEHVPHIVGGERLPESVPHLAAHQQF